MEKQMVYIKGTNNIYVTEDADVIYSGEHGSFSYTPRLNNVGYARVSIKIDGKQKEKLVHRLVAEAFIPARSGRKIVNHIDGNKLNNHVSNLEWCTHSENMIHASKMGLCNGRKNIFNDTTKKLIKDQYLNGHYTIKELAHKYAVSHSTMSRIVGGRSDNKLSIAEIKEIKKIRKNKKLKISLLVKKYNVSRYFISKALVSA